MSVIAWDSNVIAADRQGTVGGTPIVSPKLFAFKDMFFGCSGSAGNKFAFKCWIEKGAPDNNKPLITLLPDEGIGIILIKDGRCWLYSDESLFPTEIREPFWATGTGADYAMGAMAMGANAIEAVEIACRFDINCGLGVDSFSVR